METEFVAAFRAHPGDGRALVRGGPPSKVADLGDDESELAKRDPTAAGEQVRRESLP